MQACVFLKNKICPISQSGGVFAEVLKRSLQQKMRVHEFPNFQLALETFLRLLLQKLLKVRSVLVPCNPSFLQKWRLEKTDNFNHNWFTVSVKLNLTAVKVLLDTAGDMKEEAESKQMNKWKGFDFSVNWGNAFKGSANERKNSEVWGLICLRGKQGIRK